MPDHPFSRYGIAEQLSGLKAANMDPRACYTANNSITAGVVQLVEVFVPESFDLSKIILYVTTAGNTLTNAFAGIYDDTGALVAVTANQASVWNSSGEKQMSPVAPVRLQSQRRYYFAFVIGTATTMPTLMAGAQGAQSSAGSVAPFRTGTILTGQTSLPASINLASVAVNNNVWWMGAN